jgi:hypothetical protein
MVFVNTNWNYLTRFYPPYFENIDSLRALPDSRTIPRVREKIPRGIAKPRELV